MLFRTIYMLVLLPLSLSACVTDGNKSGGGASAAPQTFQSPPAASAPETTSGKAAELHVNPLSPIPMEDQILGGMAMIIPDDLLRQNKTDKALQEYAKVTENRDIPALYRASAAMARGDILARKGDFAEAAEAYESAADLYSVVSYPTLDMRKNTERAITGAMLAYMRIQDHGSATALAEKYDFAVPVETDNGWFEQSDGFLLHAHTNVMVPKTIGSFVLTKKTATPQSPEEFALSYQSDRYGAVSVFRFQQRNRTPRTEAETSYQLMSRTRDVAHTPIRFDIGEHEIAGLDMTGYGVEDRAISKSGKITLSEGVIVLARGNEFLKFRYTVVRPVDLADSEPWGPILIDNIANKIRWTNS